MTTTNNGARAAVRLGVDDLDHVASITNALSHPHREPPSISEVLRVALAHFAGSLASSGLPR